MALLHQAMERTGRKFYYTCNFFQFSFPCPALFPRESLPCPVEANREPRGNLQGNFVTGIPSKGYRDSLSLPCSLILISLPSMLIGCAKISKNNMVNFDHACRSPPHRK
ncbi:unnamed protein product [Medioppia subpectinata]|uniref:Uncharacterized protein n=1 Tax=Medioppia subpectinata TaxID=1979941 RepID=A0A7R9L3K1_9ACAR|nr:unnamed protein product [Medioppia subpectinata]CAG2114781.1 unnamed protein product [Medioppia subpectinata]